MYYIVEITPRGTETFLEGFEDIGAAWDVVSRLRCEARRRLLGQGQLQKYSEDYRRVAGQKKQL